MLIEGRDGGGVGYPGREIAGGEVGGGLGGVGGGIAFPWMPRATPSAARPAVPSPP